MALSCGVPCQPALRCRGNLSCTAPKTWRLVLLDSQLDYGVVSFSFRYNPFGITGSTTFAALQEGDMTTPFAVQTPSPAFFAAQMQGFLQQPEGVVTQPGSGVMNPGTGGILQYGLTSFLCSRIPRT